MIEEFRRSVSKDSELRLAALIKAHLGGVFVLYPELQISGGRIVDHDAHLGRVADGKTPVKFPVHRYFSEIAAAGEIVDQRQR